MRMTKEFRIQEVRATSVINAPIKILLRSNSFKQDEESSLSLDPCVCGRYSIPVSLNLAGRILVCSFERRDLPLKSQDGFLLEQIDMGSLDSDDLAIQSLDKKEIISSHLITIPPSKHREISRTLKLSSFGGGDGIHPHAAPCPFYRFALELTEGEHDACKILPATAIFKVSFRLK